MPIVAVLRERIVVQRFGTSPLVELRPYIILDTRQDLVGLFDPQFYAETWRDHVLRYVADLRQARQRRSFAWLRNCAKTLAPRG